MMVLQLGGLDSSSNPPPTSSSTFPNPKSTLLIYAQGASTLFSSLGTSIPEKDRCFIDQLTRLSYTGSMVLNPWCHCQDEFLYLLGLDTKPAFTFSTAFHDVHPHTLLYVITPSNALHVKATNLSISSTLLATSSLSSPRCWADLANTWPSYLHISPQDPLAHTVTLLHAPCHNLRDLAFLNQLLPLLHSDQFGQCILVSSWDVFDTPGEDERHQVEIANELFQSIHTQSKDTILGLEKAIQKSPPFTILYFDQTITHPDGIQSFDLLQIYKKGTQGILFSNQFLQALGSHSLSLASALPSPVSSSISRRDHEVIDR